MLQEFKKFILRGNVVDLAVGVAIGAAFNGVVSAFVSDFITPLTLIVPGSGDLTKRDIVIGHLTLHYGHFVSTLISFLCVAAVIFFFVVKPVNHLVELSRRRQPPSDPTTRKCPECLSVVPIKAARCMFCTIKLQPVEAKAPAASDRKSK